MSCTRFFVCLALFAALAGAQTTHLVPQQFATIQAAINAATGGDTILVSPGVYHESLLLQSEVSLVSTDGASSTFVDPQGTDVALRINFFHNYGVEIDGFTFRNGQGAVFPPTIPGGAAEAGGITLVGASLTIRNCVIRDCTGQTGATLFGGVLGENGGPGGLLANASFPRLIDCDFLDNQGGLGGPSMAGTGGSPGTGGPGAIGSTTTLAQTPQQRFEMTRCRVRGNTGGGGQTLGGLGGISIDFPNFLLDHLLIANNAGGLALTPSTVAASGGSVIAAGVEGLARYLTVAGNVSGGGVVQGGFGFSNGLFVRGAVTVDHALVAANIGAGSQLAALPTGTATPLVRFSNVAGGVSGGISQNNVDLPPSFADADYRLAPTSALRDLGSVALAALPDRDLDGSFRWVGAAPEMGCYEIDDLKGSEEDFQLRTIVGAASDPDFPTSMVTGGTLVAVRFGTDGGTFLGGVPALFVQVFSNGTQPASPIGFPELEINDQGGTSVIYDGNVFGPAVLGPQPYAFLFQMPPATGITARLQAVVFSPNAANGIFAASRAHDLVFP